MQLPAYVLNSSKCHLPANAAFMEIVILLLLAMLNRHCKQIANNEPLLETPHLVLGPGSFHTWICNIYFNNTA